MSLHFDQATAMTIFISHFLRFVHVFSTIEYFVTRRNKITYSKQNMVCFIHFSIFTILFLQHVSPFIWRRTNGLRMKLHISKPTMINFNCIVLICDSTIVHICVYPPKFNFTCMWIIIFCRVPLFGGQRVVHKEKKKKTKTKTKLMYLPRSARRDFFFFFFKCMSEDAGW